MKKIIFFIFASGFCYVLWWMSMNYVGYCHKEGRFLSDEEKIYSAVKYVMPTIYPKKISVDKSFYIKEVIDKEDYWNEKNINTKYIDAKEFIELNSGFCDISMKIGEIGEIESPEFIDRLLGNFSTYVTVRFGVEVVDENGNELYDKGSSAASVANCGQSWSGL